MTASDHKTGKKSADETVDQERLMSEWMKVMLEELQRKRDEHEQDVAEGRAEGDVPVPGKRQSVASPQAGDARGRQPRHRDPSARPATKRKTRTT